MTYKAIIKKNELKCPNFINAANKCKYIRLTYTRLTVKGV